MKREGLTKTFMMTSNSNKKTFRSPWFIENHVSALKDNYSERRAVGTDSGAIYKNGEKICIIRRPTVDTQYGYISQITDVNILYIYNIIS